MSWTQSGAGGVIGAGGSKMGLSVPFFDSAKGGGLGLDVAFFNQAKGKGIGIQFELIFGGDAPGDRGSYRQRRANREQKGDGE